MLESPQRVLSEQYLVESEEACSASRTGKLRATTVNKKYRKWLKSLIINHEYVCRRLESPPRFLFRPCVWEILHSVCKTECPPSSSWPRSLDRVCNDGAMEGGEERQETQDTSNCQTEASHSCEGASPEVHDTLHRKTPGRTHRQESCKFRINLDSDLGEVSQQECTNCLQSDGPWAKCVRYHDIDRVVTGCGNCQWKGRAVRCNFFQLPLVPETSRCHQRNRSSQSSMEIRVITHHEQAETGLAAVERLEDYVRHVQAEVGLHDSRNAAIQNAIRPENFADLVVPARAFLFQLPQPTTTRHSSIAS